jgi:hypothetical protein
MSSDVAEAEDRRIRMYPDQGLRRVEGEFSSSLAEVVRANFPKVKRGR